MLSKKSKSCMNTFAPSVWILQVNIINCHPKSCPLDFSLSDNNMGIKKCICGAVKNEKRLGK